MSNKVISLNNVTISRKSNKKLGDDLLLSNINLDIERGELVYLIGKVGSGKSSLLKSLYGEVPIEKGSAIVAGYNVSNIRKRDIPYLRRRLGIVFQDFQLLQDRSVYDNLLFVLKATGWKNKADIKTRIEQILNLIKLSHKAYKMPHHLSGGEQQRLTIGRAFLNHPDIILADEPTGNLDPEASKEILTLFQDLAAMGCGIVIATHDISLLENYPSRTIAFNEGELIEVDLCDIE